MYATASVMGPVLGGVIAFVLARRVLAGLPRTSRKRPIDYTGAVLLAGGLSALMIALTRLGQGVSWIAPSTLLLVAAGVLLLVLCAWREHHAPEPLLPPALFTDPVLVRCYSLFGLAFFSLMGLSVLLPLWIQSALGIGLDRITIRLLPFTLSSPLAAFLAGRRISRGGRMRTQRLVGSWVTATGLAGRGAGRGAPERSAVGSRRQRGLRPRGQCGLTSRHPSLGRRRFGTAARLSTDLRNGHCSVADRAVDCLDHSGTRQPARALNQSTQLFTRRPRPSVSVGHFPRRATATQPLGEPT